MSSSEAEYIALADCAKEVLYLRMLLECLRPELPKMRLQISEDNEGAIKLVSNPTICKNRAEHLDVRYHLLRETIEEGKIECSNKRFGRWGALEAP